MSQKFKFFQNIEIGLALASLFMFAAWWFQPSHVPSNFSGFWKISDYLLFIFVSLSIWHPIIMEVLVWIIASHIKENPITIPPTNLKVAFITTIVPENESLSLLHKCLPAMVEAHYNHDTWLLDEGGSSEVEEICKRYGVKYFSRHGKHRYNLHYGKFTRRTKGGNHNSWYDMHGKDYDVVAQLDTDFIPKPNFLTATLGFFNDPQIAFVGTPQIYGNTKNSFIARGAAEQQYYFYGTVLQGLNGMDTSLLIGANHVIRVKALKDVDYYAAHITEDLLTGMKLHAGKWKSIYLPVPLAVGEGPSTWEAYFNQQMRWAYGCMDIFFHHSFRFFKQLGPRRSLYYFFLQQHYFSGIIVAFSTILLCLYFLFGITSANIEMRKFLIYYPLVILMCWLISIRLQRFNIHSQKKQEMQIAGRIMSIAAWPIYFLAFICVLLRKRLKYKVTPKGEYENKQSLNLRLFIPHFIFGGLALVSIISTFFTHRQNALMLLWASISVFLMFVIPFSQKIATLLGSFQFKPIQSFSLAGNGVVLTTTSINKETTHDFHVLPLEKIKISEITKSQKNTYHFSDILFLMAITIASIIPYVTKIGFYSDDWSFLSNFNFAKSNNLYDLFQVANTPNTLMRPIQNLYDSLLFLAFGINPLGYQIINGLVFTAISILFYTILKQLRMPRIIALAVPLIFILMPNYTTDRFWFAAFQVNLSLMFYLLSFYSGLKALSINTSHTFPWKVFSIAMLILSILSYEVVVPFYFVNMIVLWHYNYSPKRTSLNRKIQEKNKSVFIFLIFITLIYSIVFKVFTTIRLDSFNHNGLSYISYVWDVMNNAFQVNFITLGIRLPVIWWNIIRSSHDSKLLISSALIGLVIFAYLFTISFFRKTIFPSGRWLLGLTILGFPLFILGYAIFITNVNVGFSPTGVDNRVAIAAAMGISFILVGGMGYICKLVFSNIVYKFVFCLLISIVCAGGYLMTNNIADYWDKAYKQQLEIVSDITQHIPKIQNNSVLLLDGFCPYIGPAPVFEANWDLKGALQMAYNNQSISADVTNSISQITNDGITTRIYGLYATYPYKNLVIYNYKNKHLYKISDFQSADNYFKSKDPELTSSCPAGYPGNGVSIY